MKKENSFISTFVDGNITKTIEVFYDKFDNHVGTRVSIQSDNIFDTEEVFTRAVYSMSYDIEEGFSIVGMDKMVDAHQGVFVTYVARRK